MLILQLRLRRIFVVEEGLKRKGAEERLAQEWKLLGIEQKGKQLTYRPTI
jgi:hypothetical protein